jgi:hypothetical protein
MLTYSSEYSGKGRESIVIESQALLSAASGLGTLRSATSASATAAETASAALSSVLLDVEVVLLTLEGEESGELGLADSDVVDLLVLQSVIDLGDLLHLGSGSLEAGSLNLLVASGLLLQG